MERSAYKQHETRELPFCAPLRSRNHHDDVRIAAKQQKKIGAFAFYSCAPNMQFVARARLKRAYNLAPALRILFYMLLAHTVEILTWLASCQQNKPKKVARQRARKKNSK